MEGIVKLMSEKPLSKLERLKAMERLLADFRKDRFISELSISRLYYLIDCILAILEEMNTE